jgi:hypothetical protein
VEPVRILVQVIGVQVRSLGEKGLNNEVGLGCSAADVTARVNDISPAPAIERESAAHLRDWRFGNESPAIVTWPVESTKKRCRPPMPPPSAVAP